MFGMQVVRQPVHNQKNNDSKTYETVKQQLDEDFQKIPVEEAEHAIYKKYGSENIKAQNQLLYLIQNIVTANSEEQEKLNYTLYNAHKLGDHIFTCADKQTCFNKLVYLEIAKKALHLVANAYLKLGAYSQALNVLRRLETQDTQKLQTNILDTWLGYIEKCRSAHTKTSELYMYKAEVKFLQKLHSKK